MKTKYLLMTSFLILFLFACVGKMPTANTPGRLTPAPTHIEKTRQQISPTIEKTVSPQKDNDANLPSKTTSSSGGIILSLEEINTLQFDAPVADIIWFSQNDSILAYLGDGRIFSWSGKGGSPNIITAVAAGGVVGPRPPARGKPHLFLSQDGQVLGITTEDNVVFLSTNTWEEIGSFKDIRCGSEYWDFLSPDLQYCYSSLSMFYKIVNYRLEELTDFSEKVKNMIDPDPNDNIYTTDKIVFSPDMKTVVAVSKKGQAGIWDFETKELKYSLLNGCPHGGNTDPMPIYTPDSRFILTHDCEKIFLWNVATGEIIDLSEKSSKLSGLFGDIKIRKYSNDGEFVVSVSDATISEHESEITVFDFNNTESYMHKLKLIERNQLVTGLTFSLDSRRFAVSYSDGSVHVFRITYLSHMPIPTPSIPKTITPSPALYGEINFQSLLLQSNDLPIASCHIGDIMTGPSYDEGFLWEIYYKIRPIKAVSQRFRCGGDRSTHESLTVMLYDNPDVAHTVYTQIASSHDFGLPVEVLSGIGDEATFTPALGKDLAIYYNDRIVFRRCNMVVFLSIIAAPVEKLALLLDERLNPIACSLH